MDGESLVPSGCPAPSCPAILRSNFPGSPHHLPLVKLSIFINLWKWKYFFSGPKKLQVYSPRFPDNMLDKLSWLQLTGYLIGQSGPLLWLPIIYITLISSYKKVSSRFGNSNKVSTLKTMITKAIKYLDPSASFALRPCSAEESFIKIWCGLPSWLD